MGAGGSFNSTDASTLSSYYNPAGLAYLDKRSVGLTYRNLPESNTHIGGTLSSPQYSSTGSRGSMEFSHLGYSVPMSEVFKRGKGTLAFSYTVGGYIHDRGIGPSSGIGSGGTGGFTVSNYVRTLDARSDFYTLAWGNHNAAQNLAFGLGLTYVEQKVAFSESGSAVDSSSASVPFGSSISSTGHGFGGIVGVQYTSPTASNMSFGLSYRTPIDLSANDKTSGLYSRLPGRLMLGGAYRKDNLRGGNDYLVLGADLQYFSGGDGYLAYDRSNQSVFGTGIEYNFVRENMRIPLRLGYVSSSKGGDNYGSRNSFTYGIGYHPADSDYAIDFNWGAPQGSGADFSISATYRFK